MKKVICTSILIGLSGILLSFTLYKYSNNRATCTGSKSCNACKNCKYCKHCAKEGGVCGVCK